MLSFSINVVYTDNIGPHRKLLPVLSKFWHMDCVIVTMDDDREPEFLKTALARLLEYYIASGITAIQNVLNIYTLFSLSHMHLFRRRLTFLHAY